MIATFVRQVIDEQRAFWRNRAGSLFACAFPLVMLAIFGKALEGIAVGEANLDVADYVVPGLATFAIMSTSFFHVAGITIVHRDSGHLRRIRATPRGSAFTIAGLVGSACLTVSVIVPLILLEGAWLFGTRTPSSWLGFLLVVAVAVPSLCACGFALTSCMPNTIAAQALLTGIFYPVAFLSGTFLPMDNLGWAGDAMKALPTTALVSTVIAQFDPTRPASLGAGLAVIAAWGVAMSLVAFRWFRWEPRAVA
ncbi:MAG TPA: ABC transporter permease [Candidatus Limnocylindria bacterium]